MNLPRVFELFPCLLHAEQNKTKGMKELLLEFVDENITSLHFSHCETNPDLGVQQKYVGVWPIFTCQSHEKKPYRAKCPIAPEILSCWFQYYETTRTISTTSVRDARPSSPAFSVKQGYSSQRSSIELSLLWNMKSCYV